MEEEKNASRPKPAWCGWLVDRDCAVAWGARAILQSSYQTQRIRKRVGGRTRIIEDKKLVQSVDLVPNRQGADGDQSRWPDLQKRLNGDSGLLDKLHKRVASKYVSPDSRDLIEIEENGVRLVATPNASYGYLYICAMLLP
ncbi:MAG: hypothetical protein WC683_02745 [bacterium]